MINKYWGAVLVLLPYIIKVGQLNDNRQGIDFAFSCFVAISIILFGIKPDFKVGLLLSAPILLNLVTQDDFNVYYSLSQNFMYLTGVLFIVHLLSHIDDLEDTFHKGIIASSILGAVFYALTRGLEYDVRLYVMQLIDSSISIKHNTGIVFGGGGFLGNPNVSGAFFALSIPSYFKLKLYKYSAIPLAMTLTTSSWPICTGLSFYMFYFWRVKNLNRLIPYLLPVIMLAIGFFLMRDSVEPTHDSGRFLSWSTGLELYFNSKNWFFGNGLGWFAENYSNYFRPYNLKMRQEHSEFFAALFAFGPLGLSLFVYLFKYLSKASDKTTQAAIFCIFVNCLCNFTLHMSTLFILVSFWAVIAYREVLNVEKMERQISKRRASN